MKTAVLLVNLGTPLSPKPWNVFHYLNEFLTDERVIERPFWLRQLLVRGLIVPLRFLTSAKAYKNIWKKEGSPLLIYSLETQKALQKELGQEFEVFLAMRYQMPSIEKTLEEIYSKPFKKLIIFPLFPQYASATTGSIYQKVMEKMKGWKVFPDLSFISSFYAEEGLIDTWVENAKKTKIETYDHYVFSFHGLPESHLTGHDRFNGCLKDKSCCQKKQSASCYKKECLITASLIQKKLALPLDKCTISFQSRLGKEPWLAPFTKEVIHTLAEQGKKRVLVFCPSFVTDCLETIDEIGREERLAFLQQGGEALDLVEAPNCSPLWIKALKNKIISIL